MLEVDPDTGRQWTLRDAGGHFGGSMDAVAIGFPDAPTAWHVCEFKTHSAKSFAKLPLAKDIDDFAFDGTPINETLSTPAEI